MSNGLLGTPSSDYERQIKQQGGIMQEMAVDPIRSMATPVAKEEEGETPPLFGSDFLQGLADYLGGGGAQGLAGIGLLMQAYDRLGGIGGTGLALGQQLAETQLGQAQFQPYTVTAATGGQFMAGPDGQYTMTLSPEEQAMRNQLFGGAGQFFTGASADPAAREQEIYGQIEAALDPQQRAQRLGLEERLAAQGRLGVRTAQFGGTPEQLAMEKAQAQQLAQARLSAAQQARQEQAQQAALGQQYLMGSYLPQQQLLAALSPGQTAAAQQQQAQLYGTGLFGEATASGIDALLASALGQANLMGEAGTGLLSGLFGTRSGSGGGFIDILTGLASDLGIGQEEGGP